MEPAAARPISRLLKPALGYAVAVACLVWLFHDVNWPGLLRDMGGIHWGWVSLAIVFDVLSYVCQGWRWELLLRPKGPISTAKATQAIYAGLFANEILPMRVGEVVRAFLVSRWLAADLSAIIPSIVVERLFDGIWLAISIGITAIFVERLPENLLKAGDTLGTAMLVGTALFVLVVFRKGARSAKTAREFRFKPVRLLAKFLGTLEEGLREIGRSRALYLSFAVSFLFLLGQILAFWLVMWAYGLRFPLLAGAAVLLIVRLGTAVPNAPANLGTYQFFTVLGLELFGVEKTLATGFSLVVFFLLTLPLWLIGSFAVSRTGMTLASMRGEIGRTSARPAPDIDSPFTH